MGSSTASEPSGHAAHTASEGTRELAGVRFGTTVVIERIAVGGMAEVFHGRRVDAKGEQDVVVKVLLPQYQRDAEVRALFWHEAELGARLRHPGIVGVLEFAEDPRPFTVSEFVHGVPLTELVRAGRLGFGAVVVVARDLLGALGFVHAAKDDDGNPLSIIHRDISPDNVLVDTGGVTRLIDFGVARSALRNQRTRTGIVRGKIGYLAPEQVTGSDVGQSADIYSTASVLFELACGVPFLEAESEIALLRLAEEPPERVPSSLGADPRLDRALRNALARFPEERPGSAQAFLRALDAEATPQELSDGRAELITRVAEIAPPRSLAKGPAAHDGAATFTSTSTAKRSRLFVPAAAASAIVIATAAAAMMLASPDDRVQVEGQVPPLTSDDAQQASTSAERLQFSSSVTQTAWAEDSTLARAPSAKTDPSSPPNAGPLTTSAATHATATSTASTLVAPPADGPLRSRLSALLSGLSARGISRADLDGPTLASLASAERALAAGDLAEAERHIDAVQPTIENQTIDKGLTQRKISRTNARISAARQAGKDVTAAESRSASALESFLDGRYATACSELDAILATLK